MEADPDQSDLQTQDQGVRAWASVSATHSEGPKRPAPDPSQDASPPWHLLSAPTSSRLCPPPALLQHYDEPRRATQKSALSTAGSQYRPKVQVKHGEQGQPQEHAQISIPPSLHAGDTAAAPGGAPQQRWVSGPEGVVLPRQPYPKRDTDAHPGHFMSRN